MGAGDGDGMRGPGGVLPLVGGCCAGPGCYPGLLDAGASVWYDTAIFASRHHANYVIRQCAPLFVMAVLVADRNANIYSQLTIESSADGDPGNVFDNDSTTSTATSAKEENSGWNSSLYSTSQSQRRHFNTAWQASAEHVQTPLEKNQMLLLPLQREHLALS